MATGLDDAVDAVLPEAGIPAGRWIGAGRGYNYRLCMLLIVGGLTSPTASRTSRFGSGRGCLRTLPAELGKEALDCSECDTGARFVRRVLACISGRPVG